MPRNKRQGHASSEAGVTAFYARITRGIDGDSISDQKAAFVEMAERHGWTNCMNFAERENAKGQDGEDKRPEYARLLREIRAGRVQRVVARHLDRLGRGEPWEGLLKLLRKHNVDLWDSSSQQDIRSAGGRLGIRAQAMVGDFESDRTAERVRDHKRRRAMEGRYIGPAPYGYTSQARRCRQLTRLYGSEREDEAREEAQKQFPVSPGIFIDPDEAKVVRDIFRLYVEEGWGTPSIARYLNEQGIMRRPFTKRGRTWIPLWSAQTVQKILRDPKVTGLVHFDVQAMDDGEMNSRRRAHKQLLVESTQHEAIIERDLWETANELLTKKADRITASREHTRCYPLSPVLKCYAGHSGRGNSSGSEGPAYYKCAHRAMHGTNIEAGGCVSPILRADYAEEAVAEALISILTAPDELSRLVDEVNKELVKGVPKRRDRVREIESEIEDIERRKEHLLSLCEQPDLRSRASLFIARHDVLDERLINLGAELLEARRAVHPQVIRGPSPEALTAWTESAVRQIQHDPPSFRQVVLNLGEQHDLQVVMVETNSVEVTMAFDLDGIETQTPTHLQLIQDGESPRVTWSVQITVGAPTQTVDEWVEENQGKHICACGCGEAIEIKPIHRAPTKGIPKFKHTHHRTNMTSFVESMNTEGLLTVAQAAAEVGVSTNTMRRAESKGWVTPERRKWGDRQPMRLYRRTDLPRLRQSLIQNGFRFADEETFTTADVAEKLGVSENTVRRWERDGKLPTVQRDTNGRRLYRREDMERIAAKRHERQ
jgi:site-specific DNA recombinase